MIDKLRNKTAELIKICKYGTVKTPVFLAAVLFGCVASFLAGQFLRASTMHLSDDGKSGMKATPSQAAQTGELIATPSFLFPPAASYSDTTPANVEIMKPDYLNLAYLYDETESGALPTDSIAGQLYKKLAGMDSRWAGGIFDLYNYTPSQLAPLLGLPVETVTTSSGVIEDFETIQVHFFNGDGREVSGSSNARSIVSMANTLHYYGALKNVEELEAYVSKLWEKSHSYKVHMGNIYYCDGSCLLEKEENGEADNTNGAGNNRWAEAASEAAPAATHVNGENASGTANDNGGNASGAANSSGESAGGTANESGGNAAGAANSSGDRAGGTANESGGNAAGAANPSGGSAGGTANESGGNAAGAANSSEESAGGTANESGGNASGAANSSGESADGTDNESGKRTGGDISSGQDTSGSANSSVDNAKGSADGGGTEAAEGTESGGAGEAAAGTGGGTTEGHSSAPEPAGDSESQPDSSQSSGHNGKRAASQETDSGGPGVSDHPAAMAGTVGSAAVDTARSSEAGCPGHVDLSINITIKGVTEGANLYKADPIQPLPLKEREGWSGWNETTKGFVDILNGQDWYELYGLNTTDLLVMNPLTSTEIENYMGLLPPDASPARREFVRYALASVGKIPYYWGGKPVAPGYSGNDFGSVTSPDEDGRFLRGLDCSGWVNWVYWSVTGRGLGAESTATLVSSGRAIAKSELLPGDICIRTGTMGHVVIFLGWTDSGEMLCIQETTGNANNVEVGAVASDWQSYRRIIN